MNRSVLLTVLGLIFLAIAAGLYLGRQTAALSETEVIARVVAQYARDTGGATTECAAIPGRDAGVWIVVICGEKRVAIGADGQMIAPSPAPAT